MRVFSYRSAIRRDSRACADTKRVFRRYRGDAGAVRRALEIGALPTKLWKGRRVYQVKCRADFGVGEHDQWVPASLLWSLISLDAFLCPWHR